MKNTFRFTAAIVLENILTAAVSLIYSALTGAISKSSLAAAGIGNQAMSLIVATLNIFISGATILTAREIGRGDRRTAARTAEQSLLCTPLLSLAVAGALLVLCPLIMKLLMPGAEPEFLAEGTLYFRVMLCSLPLLAMANVFSGMLRAAGDSTNPFIAASIAAGVQLVCAWAFITKLNMGLMGAALATLVCRAASALFQAFVFFRHNRAFTVQPKGIFMPDKAVILRICRVGAPNALDSLCVQIGYVAINSMLVYLGTLEAGVFNVINAVLVFTGICQMIGTNISTTLVGQATGAGEVKKARASALRTLLYTELVSMALCALAVIFSDAAAGFFTADKEIFEASSSFMWILIPLTFVAVGCNVCEPSCRAAGEVRFTMTEIVACVMLIRLPLTWLFCLKLGFGVPGMYAANIISLVVRFALSFFRIFTPGWGKREI